MTNTPIYATGPTSQSMAQGTELRSGKVIQAMVEGPSTPLNDRVGQEERDTTNEQPKVASEEMPGRTMKKDE